MSIFVTTELNGFLQCNALMKSQYS